MLTADQVNAQAKALGISKGVTLYQAMAIDRLADVLAGIAASYAAEVAQGAALTALAQAETPKYDALMAAVITALAPKAA